MVIDDGSAACLPCKMRLLPVIAEGLYHRPHLNPPLPRSLVTTLRVGLTWIRVRLCLNSLQVGIAILYERRP
ncbi:hypothetical protein E2C01_032818 [Portunus trituberculatus]|uniref:Uncharacterized protein n=1 Tax=Portunus trituberculatus TaxID=210409 RepID=A0A5B7F1D2_PORTR|nr:hypothetical protein [Portunus trituberculatus]